MTFDRRVLGLLLVLGLLGSPAALISALCVGESCRRSVSLRTTYRSRLTPKAASAAGFLVLPVVAVLVLPPATLGSFAVARRSAVGAGYVASGADISSGPVTLNDVVAAMWSPKGMEQLSRRAGSSVSFVGFVDRREGMAANEFLLTRFVVTCCVADALSVQVRVVGARPDALQEDQWVRVTGTLYPLPQEAVVKASTIESVPRPASPVSGRLTGASFGKARVRARRMGRPNSDTEERCGS